MTTTYTHLTTPRSSSAARRRRRIGAMVGMATISAAVLGGCSAQDKTDSSPAAADVKTQPSATTTSARILFAGDSIAKAEAPALEAAFTSAGASFRSIATPGGGNVVAAGDDDDSKKIAEESLADVAKAAKDMKATTIVYQITVYDWGTEEQQKQSYAKLATAAESAGAKLVMVSAPPVVDGGFFGKHAKQMATAPVVAKDIAESSKGTVTFVDSSQLWGTDPKAVQALRSADGTHNCQQGAAAFAAWFTQQAKKATGVAPAAPATWATGDWTDAKEFATNKCSTPGR
ncbi:SGNH hydrolase domain-containing protein [Aeromicrobium fastidiosum]|uniref:SGNH/GDSL hydrolase family protein n=1 Tax=Aeromicrobium fastidiosum TaxID=52699 RepID=A0A641AKR1_9ACTN|nr:SGNH hydrolase domain-containing protein [Aeromicrobium fastidiosum]KAA1376270.1 SGNH/GDSL hydrolase family protein [Aeromicrobium fastidiosum]MBP2391835.1 hypothetical protein [Aeromicrobium fastidiosum]